MASLGSFGAAIRELDPASDPTTFEFFGETFTVQDVIPTMLMLQLGAAAAGVLTGVEADGATWHALRCSLTRPAAGGGGKSDQSEFDRFYRLAVDRKCDGDELAKLVWSLMGAQADLPTGRQPTSQDGRPPTSESSNSSASDTPDSPTLASVEDRLNGLT